MKNRLTSVIVALMIQLGVGGCQIGRDSGPAGAVDRAHAGDTLLVHSRVAIRADTAYLTEVAHIGIQEGDERQMLNEVSAFTELPDGRVAVADDAGLRVFSPDGEYLELLGRTGQGPGEVQYVIGMAAAPDGTLFAADLGNRRINIYRPDGVIDDWPLPIGMPGYGRASIVAMMDGTVYVAYNPPPAADGSPTRYPRPIYVRLTPEGSPGDTLYAAERYVADCPTLSSSAWRSGFYEDLREPYFPKVKWALSHTGALAVGCPATYSVDLLQPDGSVERVSRDREPVIVSEDERRSFTDVQTFTRNRSGYFKQWSWEGPQPPEQRPAYDRLVFAQDGRLWVWPAQPSTREEIPEQFRQQGAPTTMYTISTAGAFDVFEVTGEYLGAVRLPKDVPYSPFPGRADPFIRADTVWVVRYDSLDVSYLTKYVVDWGIANPDNANGT